MQDSVASLLVKWDELRDAGNEVSADELCRESPDLLLELMAQIRQLKAMDWLDSVHIESTSTSYKTMIEKPLVTGLERRSVPVTLGGRYEMESLMAEGGFGQVWRALDTALLRPVAIKVTTVNCFAEARRVAQLKHQGIVTVHDVGNADGLCYIVFDLVDGSTLAHRLAQGSLTWRESARIVAQVAECVQFAHEKGFIHRDLKPSNILLDDNGMPVLADFGIAVTECELRHEAMTSVGTLAYMAPEQLQVGRSIDVRTDVYGLGVVFYELLTGRQPFSSPTLSGLREKILQGGPPAPRSCHFEQGHPEIPEPYERICLKCLSTEMDDRFASAKLLAHTLKQQILLDTQQF